MGATPKKARSAHPHSAATCATLVAFLMGCRGPGGSTDATSQVASAPALPSPARLSGAEPPQPLAKIDWIDLGAGRFALRANDTVALSAGARLEGREADGTFAPVPLETRLYLGGDCTRERAAANCRTLRAGDVIVPAAWDGSSCAGSCCPVRDEDPRYSGSFRWVISACGTPSSTRSASPEFALPGRYRELYRIRAAAHLQSANVAQLDPRSADDGVVADPDRIAGHATFSAEVPLSDELVRELAQWLSGPGFKDDVLRRCKRANAFGFRGVRRAASLELTEVTEIAIDLHCSSVAVVYEEGGVRRRMDAFFDPSRRVLMSILERALPGASANGKRR